MVAPPPSLHAAMHFGRQSPSGHPREEEEESSLCFPTKRRRNNSFSRETDLCNCTKRVFQSISGSRHEPISHHRRTVGGGQGLQQVREREYVLFINVYEIYTRHNLVGKECTSSVDVFFLIRPTIISAPINSLVSPPLASVYLILSGVLKNTTTSRPASPPHTIR